MARNTNLGEIDANANMKFTLQLNAKDSAGAAYNLTGCTITAQIRANAQPSTPLITPTVAFATPTNGQITISCTQVQMAGLAALGTDPEIRAKYFLEVDIAYADDSTHPADKFTGWIRLSPGGNL